MNHVKKMLPPIDSNGSLDPAQAIYLLVSMTKRCNMRCPECYLAQQQDDFFRDQDISFDAAKKIIDYYRQVGIKMVVPNAEGEVLLHAGYSQLVTYINNCGFRNKPWLVTNGILLHRHADFIAAQLGEVLISVDGATGEAYNRFRGGNAALFDEVLHGIKALVRAREQGAGNPHILINSVISRDRMKDIPELVRFAEDVGADTVKFSNFHPTGDKTGKQPLYLGDKDVETMLRNTAVRRDYKVNIMLPHLFGAAHPPYSCRMLASVVIGSNGDYSPCCRVVPEAQWGNFFLTEEKHNSASLRDFRRKVVLAAKLEDLPKICRECAHLSPQRLAFSRDHGQWLLSFTS